MPQSLSEFMNGGLVTARHPALLRAGELQRADDCVYREKDPAIWRAPGRTQYGTVVSGSPVLGLAYLPFEARYDSKILAYAGTTLWTLPVADTGTETATEISAPGAVDGDCSTVGGHTIFTANTGQPFLPSVVGALITTSTLDGLGFAVVVSAVAGSPVSGRYPAVELKKHDGSSVTSTFGAATDIVIGFQFGIVETLEQSATAAENMLEAVQYGNSYFAWQGKGTIRKLQWVQPTIVAGSGTSTPAILIQRPLGLTPVTDEITVEAITGTIPGGTDTLAWRTSLGTGYFWFLVTEIYVQQELIDGNLKDVPGGEIESIYLGAGSNTKVAGAPKSVAVASLATGVKITLPAVKNRGSNGRIATHWGIYMSTSSTASADEPPSFATFVRVQRKKITQLAAGDFAYVYETNSAQTLNATGTDVWGSANQWSNASAMTGAPNAVSFASWKDGTKYARGDSNNSGSFADANQPANKLTYTITTSGAWANRLVTGIKVRVVGRANSDGARIQHADGVYVFPTNGAGKNGDPRYMSFQSDEPPQTKDFGGQGDTWGITWGSFSTSLATFGIVIGFGYNDAPMTAWIDAIQLTIWGDSNTIDLNGKAYRVVVYRDQIGVTISEPAYGLPPAGVSTGDFFMGQLVVNDRNDETALRYSLPGEVEYFPKPYVMRLNSTQRRDKITCIKNLGTVLLVGLEHSIERVNYLPRETNVDLNDGFAHEELTGDHGIPGPLAAVKFDLPGQGTLLAYANNSGIFITNGIWTRPLNMDLDWANTVKISALPYCVFRVYPKEKWLVLYYCPAGATHVRNTRALVFSYAADKIKEGGYLPCTGPVTVSGRASCLAIISGDFRLLTGHETTGLVYNEDTGVTIPTATAYQVHNAADTLTTVTLQPLIRTRKMYPAGIEKDAREERIYVLFSAYGATVTASSTTVADSATVISSAAFGSVVVGMRVVGTGIDPGTIVIAKASSSSITISRAANASGTNTLTFDTGTIAITVRGSSIGEAVSLLDTSYGSTLTGDLIVVHNDNTKQGLELQFEKVVLPDATSVDLGVNMRLHQFTILLNDEGTEQNRSVA